MKIRRLMFIAVLSLATGLYLIFNYCHGSIGAAAGDHIASWNIKFDFTTTGWPMILGTPLTLLGALLLLIAAISTIVAEIREPLKKRRQIGEPADEQEETQPKAGNAQIIA
jgi:hypothetical protein